VLRLQAGGGFEGPGRQATGGGHGHGLHLRQIDIQPGPVFAKSAPGDNFSPAVGQLLDAF
jgi:hypothetical protein